MNWFFSKKKEGFFLVLDIGTRSVKSLFCFKDKSVLYALSAGLKNFSEYESKHLDSVKSAKTAVFDSFKSGVKNISFSLADKKIKSRASRIKRWDAVLTFSPDVFKARVAVRKISRENRLRKITAKEERKIIGNAIEEGKKEILHEFLKESGIVSKDIRIVSAKPFGFKIDGYPVSEILGFEGKEVEVKMLFVFIPMLYWKALMEVADVLKKDIRVRSVMHLAEGMISGLKSGMYLDVGGEVTQYFKVKEGQLEELSEFNSGGSSFSEALSDDLGIIIDMAEDMQEQYCENLLSMEARAKMKEIFQVPKNNWYNRLVEELNRKNANISSIYLFGGASALPELQDVFKEKAESSKNYLHAPATEIFLPSNLKDATNKIIKPQWTPAATIANKYAKENF